MIRLQQPALSLLAIGLIGMGTLSVLYRDFALAGSRFRNFIQGGKHSPWSADCS